MSLTPERQNPTNHPKERNQRERERKMLNVQNMNPNQREKKLEQLEMDKNVLKTLMFIKETCIMFAVKKKKALLEKKTLWYRCRVVYSPSF